MGALLYLASGFAARGVVLGNGEIDGGGDLVESTVQNDASSTL
jgi:hypothetical protein